MKQAHFFLWIIGLYTAGKGLLVMYYLQASAYFHTMDFNLVWLFRRMTIQLRSTTYFERVTYNSLFNGSCNLQSYSSKWIVIICGVC